MHLQALCSTVPWTCFLSDYIVVSEFKKKTAGWVNGAMQVADAKNHDTRLKPWPTSVFHG